MRSVFFAPVLAAIFTIAPAAAQTLPSVAVPPEIERVLRAYEKAWADNDAKAIASLFAPDGIALPGNQPPARGAEAITRAYSGGGGLPTYLRAIDYRSAGDLAYVVGAYGPAGQARDVGKFVLVLRRVDGRWMIAADIENDSMPMRPQPRPQH